ncbi:MAG: DUF2314 domain-containing protein [Rhodospirillales bacterium]|nr:DUF2314 domain-containing protein [Alphaproteobacteria bacterium]MCB9976113.1 DUF2314 domain-containing protein [Rhodospirillales bacterium]
MTIIVITLIVALIGVAACLNMISPGPEFMPLVTDPDEPLLKEAMEKAQGTLETFYELLGKFPENALVKLYFVSNTDQVEHLWAEVLEREGEGELKVRLVTPPVTHKGQLDRLYTCTTEEIEDWAVRDDEDCIYGGFTERAMFAIAERDGVKLPEKLLERKAQYREI